MKRFRIYARRESGRSRHVAEAMAEGLRRHGKTVDVEIGFSGVRGDCAVAYGWNHRHIFEAYQREGGHFLYVDLGFWDRKPAGAPRDGYHKVVLDSWCPTLKMRRGCPDDRLKQLRIQVHSQGRGNKIVIAGMSAKSARDHNFAAHQWETKTVRHLQSVSQRPIIYRPKPSWEGARPIPGTEYIPEKSVSIYEVMADAWFLATHHSNCAIDAVVAGVPYYCEKGVGSVLSAPNMTDIETVQAASEKDRRAYLADIAYLQWLPSQMRSGECWEHMRSLA